MTSEQRTISRWFDEHPSVNTPDIYNSEWSVRVADWKRGDNIRPSSVVSGNKLNFSILFVNHPVASIYLWNLLQAFHELDKAVCEHPDKTKPSRELYSTEAGVENAWCESLQNLKRIILTRAISNNDFMLRMYEIRCAVDKLDVTLAELREVVVADVVKNILVENMLDEIDSAVEWRFNMIDKALMFDNKEIAVLNREIKKQQTLDNLNNEQEPDCIPEALGEFNPLPPSTVNRDYAHYPTVAFFFEARPLTFAFNISVMVTMVALARYIPRE